MFTGSMSVINEHEVPRKRRKVKLTGPINELFIKWLEEWYVETATKGSKIQYAFGKALVSLKRYPLPLKSGKECMVLEHFGPGICLKLDRQLAEYRKQNPGVLPDCEIETPTSNTIPNINNTPDKDLVEVVNNSPAKKSVKSPRKSSYMPAKNTPAFSVLVAMHENGLECSISNVQLQIVVQRIHNNPSPASCIDNLIQRRLISENSNSDVFTLTDEGRKVAELVYAKYLLNLKRPQNHHVSIGGKINSYNSRLSDFDIIPLGNAIHDVKSELKSEIIDLDGDDNAVDGGIVMLDGEGSSQRSYKSSPCKSTKSNSQISQSTNSNSQSSQYTKSNSQSIESGKSNSQTSERAQSHNSASSDETICMLPNSFDILLAVDNHETGVRYTVQTETLQELIRLDVKHEVKGLKIGDFTWIARDAYGNELVLPYIVERKRMDDFAQSIKDSRFQEQKFRLKRCGSKNLIYLVENYGSNMFLGLPLSSVLQAATNTEVIDGFTVKFTKSHAHSMIYLQGMTTFLTSLYRHKTLISTSDRDEISQDTEGDVLNLMKFKQFNQLSNKLRNYKVKEMFIKQLMQLSGLSLAKALVIVERYPTPLILVNAFHEHGQDLLADIKYTQLGTRIGNVVSNALYQFYTRQTFT